MIILIDMDGVIADFEGKIIEELNKKHPEIKIIESRDDWITNFYKKRDKEIFETIENIRNSKGFIIGLKPINGSIEALKYLLEKGHDVFICSSPLSKNKDSLTEKFEWVLENLGEDWRKRLILIKDKTLIRGDILIEDKSRIDGLLKPSWEHIIFDQPYNKNIKNKRRINWNNYKDVLGV